MNYLSDTCALSEFLNKKPDPKVIEWFEKQIEDALFVSVLTIGEINKGIVKLPASKRKTELETWLKSILFRYDKRILPISLSIATRWGRLLGELEPKGRVLPIIDSLIAATALEHDLTIITRNESDFADTGVKILNIWE
ncbi:MAG: type II toxin-antitoxin system VapC family toxin [Blastocatellia bacterium]|nr:type II toxin-antitoxin system VapC family toxin [Blastocatellia bacterium]